jgi:hypothetical protein
MGQPVASGVSVCVLRGGARDGAGFRWKDGPTPGSDVEVLAPISAQALYEAFEVKHYFTAFFTFFISVSLFDLESRFFAPTHMCWKSPRAGGCQGRPSLCADLTLHRLQAEP